MKLVTIKEVSRMLQVKESTLYTWAKRGLIPSHKLNGLIRFEIAEVLEWAANSRPTPSSSPLAVPGSHRHLDIDNIVKKVIDDVKGSR